MKAKTLPQIFPECVAPDNLHLVNFLLHVARQGMFACEAGAPGLLKLFNKYGAATIWFIREGRIVDTDI